MDDAGRLRRLGALRDRPRARFLRTRRQVGLQTERVEADAGELVETRLVLTRGCQQLGGILGVEVDQLGLDLGIQEDGLRRRDERRELRLAGLVGEDGPPW